MSETNNRLGVWLMVATTFVFAMQDGLSQHLASEYNVLMVVMIRYWFFAAFVMFVASRRAGACALPPQQRNLGCKAFGGCCWPPRSA